MEALRCRWLANDVGIVPGFFSPEECTAHIALGERLGYEEAPVTIDGGAVFMKDVRNNDRVMFDDAVLAAELWQRIAPFVPQRFQKKWQPVGLNERLRFYRYDPGQQFDWHHDGYFERPSGERSFFTFMVYLNEDFEGGQTSFSERGHLGMPFPAVSVRPRTGMALIFHHPIAHKGEAIVSGRKYVLRTDVMFQRFSTAV